MHTDHSTESASMNAKTMPEIGDLYIHDGYLGEVVRTFDAVEDPFTNDVNKASFEVFFPGMPYAHTWIRFERA